MTLTYAIMYALLALALLFVAFAVWRHKATRRPVRLDSLLTSAEPYLLGFVDLPGGVAKARRSISWKCCASRLSWSAGRLEW